MAASTNAVHVNPFGNAAMAVVKKIPGIEGRRGHLSALLNQRKGEMTEA